MRAHRGSLVGFESICFTLCVSSTEISSSTPKCKICYRMQRVLDKLLSHTLISNTQTNGQTHTHTHIFQSKSFSKTSICKMPFAYVTLLQEPRTTGVEFEFIAALLYLQTTRTQKDFWISYSGCTHVSQFCPRAVGCFIIGKLKVVGCLVSHQWSVNIMDSSARFLKPSTHPLAK